MADEGIPDDFDVVVVGTGLAESIFAAACARVGSTVLHVDSNDYYGDSWASFNLEQLLKWVEEKNNPAPTMTIDQSRQLENVQLNPNERLIPLGPKREIFSNVEFIWNADEEESPAATCVNDEETKLSETVQSCAAAEKEECQTAAEHTFPAVNFESNQAKGEETGESSVAAQEPENITADAVENMPTKVRWTKSKIQDEWRRFSVDLTPRTLLGRGEMVKLLIDSNVGRYAEFKAVDRILTCLDGELKIVPCSRSDVFQSEEISMLEKRMLMKFLTLCLNIDQNSDAFDKEHGSKTFEAFLNEQSLTPALRHYVIDALAMVDPKCSSVDGMRAVNEFLLSTGRYSSSPFLWTIYGSGELPQCFCRLCAVFGGIYCLRRSLDALVYDESTKRVSAILSNERRITCRSLIANRTCLTPLVEYDERCVVVSRAVIVTDASLKPDEREHITLLNVRVSCVSTPVKILELEHSSMVCPKGLYLVHLLTLARKNCAREDLEPVIDLFFSKQKQVEQDSFKARKPNVLWMFYFNQKTFSPNESEEMFGEISLPENLVVTCPSDSNFNYEKVVKEIRAKFEIYFPDTPFLEPHEPNPDEEPQEERNDPGINGFTPDPEPPAHHQHRTHPAATVEHVDHPNATNTEQEEGEDIGDKSLTQPKTD